MALTDAKIRSLKARSKPYKLGDFDGLYIYVTPIGSKLWRFKYRIDGKEKLLSIGAYPATSLVEARKQRDEARSQVASGIDSSALKRERQRANTRSTEDSFEEVSARYLDKLEREGRAASTIAKIKWFIRVANESFGRSPLSEVTAPVVLMALKKLEARERYESARRMRTTIGAV